MTVFMRQTVLVAVLHRKEKICYDNVKEEILLWMNICIEKYRSRNEVEIVLKKDQKTGVLTTGTVKKILTKKNIHTRGIKVMLSDGKVGRVKHLFNRDCTIE